MEAKRAHSANTTPTDQKEGPEENSGTQTQVSGTLQGAQYQVPIENSTVYNSCCKLGFIYITVNSRFLLSHCKYSLPNISDSSFPQILLGSYSSFTQKTLYNSPFLPQNNEMLFN